MADNLRRKGFNNPKRNPTGTLTRNISNSRSRTIDSKSMEYSLMLSIGIVIVAFIIVIAGYILVVTEYLKRNK
jgi:hypothetical protein